MNVKQFVTSSFIYVLIGFMPAILKIFLFPVFVKYLTPYDYGLIGLNAVYASFITIVVSFGLDNSFLRYFFVYRKNKKVLDSYLSTMMTSVFLIGLLLLIILTPSGNFINGLIFNDKSFTFFPYGFLAIINAIFISTNALMLSYYRNLQKPFMYFVFSTGIYLFSTLLEFIAIIWLNQKAEGVLIARVVGLSVMSVFFYFLYFRKSRFSFDIRFLPASFKYGAPLIIYSILGFIYYSYDRILIENYLSVKDVGIYNSAFTIAQVLEIVMTGLQFAFQPALYDLMGNFNVNRSKIDRIYRVIGFMMVIFALVIFFSSPFFIRYFASGSFADAAWLVPIVTAGFLIRFFYIVYVTPLFYFNKTTKLPYLNLISGVVVVAANIILIPRFGLIAVGYSMVLSRIAPLPLVYLWGHKDYGKVKLKLLLPVLGVIIVSFILVSAFHVSVDNLIICSKILITLFVSCGFFFSIWYFFVKRKRLSDLFNLVVNVS